MELDARMAALRERFRVRAADDRATILAARDAGDFAQVARLAHGLSGSGGVFGFPELSADAQAVENAIDAGAKPEEIAALCDRLLVRLAQVTQGG
jgi:HPt (histidine-containing phosphotransfer) domain-containing protein